MKGAIEMNSLFDGFTNGVEIPRHWENGSYKNDACPSYYANGYQIWIDHPDPNQRELGVDKNRFAITLADEYGERTSLFIQSDNWDFILWIVEGSFKGKILKEFKN
jgi:hypothetical protein|tara:strand:+ start:354 stop:671 length:318 start_codon:yes stop_codon:yes gene_type:complete